jgi:glycosyltransferase involved in cell wall biosynthesis
MRVGFLPALGGGLRELASTGQAARLIDGYFRPYAAAFDGLTYFSYLPERLEEFTKDPALLASVRVLGPSHETSRGWRAVTIPWTHAADIRSCRALRVFQITGVIPALQARARFGIPYVPTYGFWYGTLTRGGARSFAKRVVTRLGLRGAAAVIVTTDALAAHVRNATRRVELIPNGVATAVFRPPPGGRPRACPRRILYVGRLSEEKNLSTVIAAAALLSKRVPVRLVLIGGGPLAARLRQEAVDAGVDVEFRGVLDQRALPSAYAEADAFVLASFTEGHPKVLLEALSAGLPCVASDCDGNRSLVRDGATGLLFDPRRADELAASLERVLTDDALAARLGSAGRALIVQQYDLAGTVAREIQLIREIAK